MDNEHSLDLSMASKMAGILEVLNDGNWHTLEGIRRKMKLNNNQIQQIAEFLVQYEFASTDETRRKIRIEKAAREFLGQKTTS